LSNNRFTTPKLNNYGNGGAKRQAGTSGAVLITWGGSIAQKAKYSQMANVLGAVTQLQSRATSVTQSPARIIYTWNHNLQIGSPYPDDIRALQVALTQNGVYAGEITGGFYNHTYWAVQAFQKKYGIESTGFVGPETRSKLNSLYSN